MSKKLALILLIFIFACKTTAPRRMYVIDSTIVRADTTGLKIIKIDSTKIDTVRSVSSHTTTSVLRPPRGKEFSVWQALVLAAAFVTGYFLKK